MTRRCIRCAFGWHDWNKWEQYHLTGTAIHGLIAPAEVRGKTYEYSELRERRTCQDCGKRQDELIREP
jgi:hypothetical protein